jgi:hypothetical protein
MQGLDIVGPVAAGDLGVGADTLLILCFGVGVVAQDAYFIVIARTTEVGDDQVDEVLVGGVVFILESRVVGGGGSGFSGRIDGGRFDGMRRRRNLQSQQTCHDQ